MTDSARSRTYEWEDQSPLRMAAPGLTGREILDRILAKDLPGAPIAATLGMEVDSVGDGEVTFAITPHEFHYNPLGTMHGGVYATILDSALGCAIHTKLARGQGYTTLTLEIKYLRAATKDTGRLSCTGRVVNLGRQVATGEATLIDGKGRLYATATTTCILFPPPVAATESPSAVA